MKPSPASRARALMAPLRLVRARVAARPGRGLLAAVGVGAAVAMLGATSSGGAVASERALDRAVERLPVAQRALTVVHAGPVENYAAADRRARSALAGIAPGRPAASVLYRTLRLDHGIVLLGGVDDIGRYVRLTSGRLPRSCLPTRCEVLQVDGPSLPHTATEGASFVRVGTAVLRSPLPFGSTANLGERAGSRRPPPTLLAGSVRSMALMPGLTTSYRTFSWSEPLPPGIRSWKVDGLLRDEGRTLTSLQQTDTGWLLTGPDQALLEARSEGRVAGRRMLLVGGEAAALLLGFTVLAAVGLRRDALAERRRLERRGARASQLAVFSIADSGWVAGLGVLLGVVVAVAVGAFVAGVSGLPAADLLTHSIVGPRGLLGLVLCWLVATGVLVAVQLVPSGAPARRAADLVALGAAAALVLALARGGADPGALARRADPLLPALPLLAALVAGIAVARVLGWSMQRLERPARRGPLRLRLAALALARDSGPASIAAGFLAVAFGLGILASSYRATLTGGQVDEAAYAVPADAVVREGASLELPLQAAPLDRWGSLGGGSLALPVVRLPGSAATGGASTGAVQLVGIPATGLGSLRLGRSGIDPGPAASALAPGAEPHPTGPAIGAGPVSVSVRRDGDPVTVTLVLAHPDGGVEQVGLGLSPRRGVLHGRAAGPGRLVAVELGQDEAGARSSLHQGGEGGIFSAPRGTLTLGPLQQGGATVADWSGWIGKGGAQPLTSGGIRYSVPGVQPTLIRPVQPTDGHPVPLIVSADLARSAANGRIGISIAGLTLAGRVVGVADRFPTVAGSTFALADENWLTTALGADDPGSVRPQELWLVARHPGGAARLEDDLAQPPYDDLARATYAGTLRGLQEDPLARGILLALEGAAALALLLALGGLLVSVAGSIRDERAELFDLEAQGVGPADLRAELRLRAALVAGCGLAAGLLVGVVLSRLAADLVQVAAGTGSAQPPLVARAGWLPLLAGLLLFVALAFVGVGLLTRSAFSRAVPRRPSGVAP